MGSTFAEVERTGLRAWTVRATLTHQAELVGFNHSGIRGKQGPSREGRYVLPFEVYVTTKDPEATVPAPGWKLFAIAGDDSILRRSQTVCADPIGGELRSPPSHTSCAPVRPVTRA
jgi:hypothetical protein